MSIHDKGKVGGEPLSNKRATRWVMRNLDRPTTWETRHRYTPEQVKAWECSEPVSPIIERS